MQRFTMILNWLITLFVPVILVLSAVRVLMSPIFINLEYRMPYFPADGYGFTQTDRLYWADLSREYLLNDAGIDFLAELRFPDGQQAAGDCDEFATPRDCSFFYNDRELRHMLDVKAVVKVALAVLGLSLLLVIGVGFWAYTTEWWLDYRRALMRGGQLTIGLIILILTYLVLNFNSLFVNFHRVFFESGTWMFQFSDSLIRLFPLEFWRDAFIWVGLLSLIGSGVLIYLMRAPVELSRSVLLKTQRQKPRKLKSQRKTKRRR